MTKHKTMNRRLFLSSISAPMWASQIAKSPPNFVVILADDMGWGDAGMNGCPDIETPNIDSIARQGVRMTQFYANAPECTPTRCALLTGRYQQRVGGLECAIGVNNIGRYDEAAWLQSRGELGLPVTELTLPRILKDAGYDTACVGKWHLGYLEKFWPSKHGFDHTFTLLGGGADYYTHAEQNEGAGQVHLYENGIKTDKKGYLTDLFTEGAVSWLKQRSKSKPFFLYLPYTAPHAPIQDPSDFDAKSGTAPHRNKDRRAFAAVVERMDNGVGAVLQQLDAMGVSKDTLVLFLTDNGADPNGRNEPFRGRKSSVYEGGIRVPCCFRWPGGLPAGRTVTQLGMTMDLLPTIVSAAGLAAPSARKVDGIDLLPFLQGKRETSDRTVFWRYKRGTSRRKAAREGPWKYTNDSGVEALFNLASDPRESNDLLQSKPEVATKLKAKLAEWERDVQSPRLRDFRPPIPG
jgi:N-acetylgalactosamine-6-sulfatase